MKLKHYLLIGLVAWLGAHLPFDLRWPIDRNVFGPLMTHAQQGGFYNYSNIHMTRVTADFTDGSGTTALQNTPLQIGLPANQAVNYWVDCVIAYSQATNVADNFGVQFVNNAPTNSLWSGIAATNATAYATGPAPTITSTTATNVLAFTPAVTTVLMARFWGYVEMPSTTGDTILNVMVAQATAANVIVVKRDSACMWHSMN